MSVVCIHLYVYRPNTSKSSITLTAEYPSYTDPDVLSLASQQMLWLVGTAHGLSVLCDVLITAGLSYYLNSKRTGFKR